MKGMGVKRIGSALVVSCRGDITFDNTAEIRRRVEEALAEADYSALVLDLSEVCFMDSSGIGTLVALNSKVYSVGKRLYLLSPAEQVLKTLEMVKLTEFFDIMKNKGDLDILTTA